MDLIKLEQKLLEVGRSERPSDKVPYAFEKRIMARLTSVVVEDIWSFWGKAMWQGALASVVLCVAMSAWSFTSSETQVTETELSEVYESTVYAGARQIADSW